MLCEYCNLEKASDYKEPIPRAWTTDMPSKGIGDTVVKITQATGVRRIVKTVSKIIGIPCECEERQEWLNEKFPYNK